MAAGSNRVNEAEQGILTVPRSGGGPQLRSASAAPKVLHVPYTYFPDASGGTETYVRGLTKALRDLGHANGIAAPGAASRHYDEDGERVYRFQGDTRARLDLAYGAPDEVAAANFRQIVTEFEPDIVHLHARSAAVSELLCDIAHEAGAKVVFTYHTPTVSCGRGTMMLYGRSPCDGVLRGRRCSACVLSAHGMPRIVGALIASIPDRLAATLTAVSPSARFVVALQAPGLIRQNHLRFHSFVTKVDRIVVLCDWVRGVLARNGVPDEKIVISRHGIANPSCDTTDDIRQRADGPLRLAYFGRIQHAKGPDLLVRAVAGIADNNVTLDLYAIPEDHGLARKIEQHVAGDSRIRLLAPVAPAAVRAAMREYDMVAIPSRWLETGPLVALEAFAAGVPVLGANLGGISENVRDGIDGVLVAPDDAEAWSAAIAGLAADRSRIEQLKKNIRPPRTVDEVARDMSELYRLLQAH